MTILEALKPRTFYKSVQTIVRNYQNKMFYRSTILQLSKSGVLSQYGLILDVDEMRKSKKLTLFNRPRYIMYYALNLEPEILLMGEEAIELEKSRVYESLLKKKPLFEKAGLGELIEAETERIKSEDYYAYLIQIKYRPISTRDNLFYVIIYGAIVSLLAYALIRIGFEYQSIFDWINNVMTSK